MSAETSWEAIQRTIDLEGIHRAALRDGRSFLQDLIPGGKFRSLEYVVRNPRRDDKNPGSFKINYKMGVWKDFASGDGGDDLISLVAYIRGVGQGEAAHELADKLGVPVYKTDDASKAATDADGAGHTDNEIVIPIPIDAPSAPVEHIAELVTNTESATRRSDAPDSSEESKHAVVAIDKVNEEIRRLASLSIVQYELERDKAAKSLGIRASVLDEAVNSARPVTEDTKGQGRPFELLAIEPWPSAVDGAELLNEVTEEIKRFIILPANSAEIIALWAMHTYCFNCFGHSPRAAITSPEKGCGKTTTLDVLECLVSRPLSTANATVAAIFRIVEQATPTLLIDEADTFLKENDELRGILNTGHRRGGQVLRTVGDDYEPRQFSTWAPAAIAMIGRLPDTLHDRSVIINLRRRKPAEEVKSFRRDRADDLHVLARKMARWAQDHQVQLTASDPDMGELINRVADNWRPLFAIADVAGGPWPKRVREIAVAADNASTEQSVSVLLLRDIRWIFDGRPEISDDGRAVLRGVVSDRISSAELVSQLVAIEGRPWAEWKAGREITQNGLARMLDRFGIRPGTIRLHTGQTPKGYYRSAFDDAFSCYLPSQTATPPQLNSDGHFDDVRTATPEQLVAVSKAQKPNNDGHCGAVAVANPTPDQLGSKAGADGALTAELEKAEPIRWRASI